MKDLNYQKRIELLLIIFVIGGIFGFIYELLFYRIDLGYFVKRGSTFGPWIPIYGFGSIFITLITLRFHKKPLLVFLLSMIISGILEFSTGFILNHFFHLRLWSYNTEIWNFGNINGYICLRSVLFFGLSGLFLIYGIIPFCKKYILYKKLPLMVMMTLSLVFIADMMVYLIIK